MYCWGCLQIKIKIKMGKQNLYSNFLNLCKLNKLNKLRKRRLRRWKVRPVNSDRVRFGYYQKMFKRILNEDEEQFFIHTRMKKDLFNMLKNLISPVITKPKQQIHAEQRLAMTIQFLAHATSFQSLAWSYKVGKSTVRHLVLETCEALWTVLSTVYLSEPTVAQYKDIAQEFSSMWNMPNCVGAIDGKHIAINCPKNSGSMFFNYNFFFSIVLMAACDAKYTFTSISVGSYGSESDGGVFGVSEFGKSILDETMELPMDIPLPGTRSPFPHFFVGDAAFPLKRNLMRPYPGSCLEGPKTIFNYRLSRARRTIENSFGILTTRWRILNTTLELIPDNTEKVVLACLVLHNFIMLNDFDRWYCPLTYVDRIADDESVIPGDWRTELQGMAGGLRSISSHNRRSSALAVKTREILTEYLCKERAVSFNPSI